MDCRKQKLRGRMRQTSSTIAGTERVDTFTERDASWDCSNTHGHLTEPKLGRRGFGTNWANRIVCTCIW